MRKGRKASDETRKKLSESHMGQIAWNKGRPFSEETKQRMSEAQKRRPPLSETARKNLSDSHKGRIVSEETREKISKSQRGRVVPEERKVKMSLSAKGRKASPETKKKMSEARRGSLHHNWRGGITKHPYCPKFNEVLREEVRQKFDRKCILCGAPENGRKHAVHHVNFDKKAGCYGRKWNLIPVCTACHAKTGQKRHYYFNLLANYWAMNPEINLIFI